MMNRDSTDEMQIQLLLESDLLHAPEDFSQRVLQEIEREAFVSDSASDTPHKEVISNGLLEWWQWLAVAVGSLVGMTQVSRFIFGFWLSAAVG